MFERYTEKARRTIFFACCEAASSAVLLSKPNICCWLLREDKALASRFLRSHAAVESIRKQIEGRTAPGQKVSTSLDLPLSHDCSRVLAYGGEEARRLNHKHIGTEHLLLGLLLEKRCFAAQLLGEQGLTLDSVRQQVQQSESSIAEGGSIARLDQWLAEREAGGGIYTVKRKRVANRSIQFAIYAVDQPKANAEGQDMAPAESSRRFRSGSISSSREWSAPSPIMNSRKRDSTRTKNGESASGTAKFCPNNRVHLKGTRSLDCWLYQWAYGRHRFLHAVRRQHTRFSARSRRMNKAAGDFAYKDSYV